MTSYSNYLVAYALLKCRYTYVERNSILYIKIIFLRLFRGMNKLQTQITIQGQNFPTHVSLK